MDPSLSLSLFRQIDNDSSLSTFSTEEGSRTCTDRAGTCRAITGALINKGNRRGKRATLGDVYKVVIFAICCAARVKLTSTANMSGTTNWPICI